MRAINSFMFNKIFIILIVSLNGYNFDFHFSFMSKVEDCLK